MNGGLLFSKERAVGRLWQPRETASYFLVDCFAGTSVHSKRGADVEVKQYVRLHSDAHFKRESEARISVFIYGAAD